MIVGGGEHARVVAEAALARPDAWQVLGFTIGAHEEAGPGFLGLPALGTDDELIGRLADGPATWLVLGFGRPAHVRGEVVEHFGADARWATIVHPAAIVSPTAQLEAGAVVLAGAIVNTGARVGAHAIVNSAAVVEHDVEVGAFAHVAPGVVIGGGARIGDRSLIGLGAKIRDHVTVGADATVGMGAVVVGDVPDGVEVVGLPAKPQEDGGHAVTGIPRA